MTFLSRDSEGKRIPNPQIKDFMTPQHLTESEWIDLIIEMGFVFEPDLCDPSRDQYTHSKDGNLSIKIDHEANRVAILGKDNILALVYYNEHSTLEQAIHAILNTIRGLYEITN
jgi:hypothetical protein